MLGALGAVSEGDFHRDQSRSYNLSSRASLRLLPKRIGRNEWNWGGTEG